MANQSKKIIKKIVKTQVGELAIPSLYTRLASSATAQTPKKLKIQNMNLPRVYSIKPASSRSSHTQKKERKKEKAKYTNITTSECAL